MVLQRLKRLDVAMDTSRFETSKERRFFFPTTVKQEQKDRACPSSFALGQLPSGGRRSGEGGLEWQELFVKTADATFKYDA